MTVAEAHDVIERVERDLCGAFPRDGAADPHRSRRPRRRARQSAGRGRRVRQAREGRRVNAALLARRCLRRPAVRRQPGRGHAARRLAARRDAAGDRRGEQLRRDRLRGARRRPARPTGSCAGSRPTVEIRLCGHATLASGPCPARAGRRRAGDLPHRQGRHARGAAQAAAATSWRCRRSRPSRGELARSGRAARRRAARSLAQPRPLRRVTCSPARTRSARSRPTCAALGALGDRPVHLHRARASETDVVSRVFVPGGGVDEDSVTGSAHAVLTPFWAARLGRDSFTAHQASARGGDLTCRLEGDRAWLGGHCVTVVEGRFYLLGIERDDLGQLLAPARGARRRRSCRAARRSACGSARRARTGPGGRSCANRLVGPALGEQHVVARPPRPRLSQVCAP